MPVQSLGWEDLLEEEMATYFSILAWGIPWTEKGTVHGVAKSRTRLNIHVVIQNSPFMLLAVKSEVQRI